MTMTTQMIYSDNDEAMTALMIMISSCSLALLGSGASLFVLSAMLSIRRAIAVNNRLVPTEPLTAKIIDPFCLSELGGEDIEVDVVDFSTSSYSISLLVGPKGIVLGRRSLWQSCAKDIPLLNEIKDVVKKGRDLLSVGLSRAAKRDSFVFVQVRGETILVANKPRCVELALTSHPRVAAGTFEDEASTLSWFLAELTGEIETLRETGEEQPEEDEAAKAIKAGLAVLRASSAVGRANWRPRKHAIRVTKMNKKSVKDFKVPSPKTGKTQKAAIDKTVADALRWAERFARRGAEGGLAGPPTVDGDMRAVQKTPSSSSSSSSSSATPLRRRKGKLARGKGRRREGGEMKAIQFLLDLCASLCFVSIHFWCNRVVM